MATMTRPKKAKKSNQPAPARATREAEAPDRGQARREAPEDGRLKMAEAPDAGEGRAAHVEHEFTHGRSQS